MNLEAMADRTSSFHKAYRRFSDCGKYTEEHSRGGGNYYHWKILSTRKDSSAAAEGGCAPYSRWLRLAALCHTSCYAALALALDKTVTGIGSEMFMRAPHCGQ